jgi:hypothetical protein
MCINLWSHPQCSIGRTVRRNARKKNVQKFKSINPIPVPCWSVDVRRVRVPVKQARANICSLRHSLVGPGWPYRIFAVAQIALALNQPTCYQYIVRILIFLCMSAHSFCCSNIQSSMCWWFFPHFSTLLSAPIHNDGLGKWKAAHCHRRLVHPFRCFSSTTFSSSHTHTTPSGKTSQNIHLHVCVSSW